ncbi:hypothetical protein ACOMHN_003577 [Nucella lapillus]
MPISDKSCDACSAQYNYLPPPFKAYGDTFCVEAMDLPPSVQKKANVSKYTSALCRRMCIDALAQSKCGCRFADVSFVCESLSSGPVSVSLSLPVLCL